MKKSSLLRYIVISTVTLGIIAVFNVLSSCSSLKAINRTLESAVHSFDNAIAALSQESADWQMVVTDLEKQVTKDMQSTIRIEVQNLTSNAVSSTGAEVRCNSEFVRIKLRRELIEMRNSLANEINTGFAKSKSKYHIELIPEEPLQPYICDIVPSNVNLDLSEERRMKLDIYGFDLRSLPIFVNYRGYGRFQRKSPYEKKIEKQPLEVSGGKELRKKTSVSDFAVSMYGKIDKSSKVFETDNYLLIEPNKVFIQDISAALSVISDFHAVLDLTGSGADIPPNANEIVFGWNNRVQSEVAILTEIKTLICNSYPKPIGNQVFNYIPPHTKGDKDFNGNGPCMNVDVSLVIDPTRKYLKALCTVTAYECKEDHSNKKDYTAAVGTKEIILYVAQDNETISGYDVEPNGYYHDYRDSKRNEKETIYPGGFIDNIEFYGDFRGDEAGSKTGIKLQFKNFNVIVKTCTYE